MKIIRSRELPPDFDHPYGVYVESLDAINNPMHEFYAAFYWCKDNFGYEPNRMKFWADNCTYFWFNTEEDRNWFILRWSE